MSSGKRIAIDALAVDMVTAEPVTDRSGRLLVGSGVVISDDHVRNLRAWGISEVLIDVPDAATDSEPARAPAGDLLLRFTLNDVDQPPFPTLLDVCAEQIEKGFTQ